jgi:hypothetical protein
VTTERGVKVLTSALHWHPVRLEQPAVFHHKHDRQGSQRAEEKPGRKRQKRAVVVLADRGADANAEQRRDRPVRCAMRLADREDL